MSEETDVFSLSLQKLANSKAHTSRFISANLPCNKFKNRLVNIMPFESTRVCLLPIRGVEGSDYINKSSAELLSEGRKFTVLAGCTSLFDCVLIPHLPISLPPSAVVSNSITAFNPCAGVWCSPGRKQTCSHWCLHLVKH